MSMNKGRLLRKLQKLLIDWLETRLPKNEFSENVFTALNEVEHSSDLLIDQIY